jgi:hypothetical protein
MVTVILVVLGCQVFVKDRLCGLVVRVPGYRSRGPGSIPSATRFFRRSSGSATGPLSLVSTIEQLLVRKSSDSGLENQDCCHKRLPHWLRSTPLSAKVGTSPTSGGHSVSIVCSRTQATEFSLILYGLFYYILNLCVVLICRCVFLILCIATVNTSYSV